jgi:hypothetical protein
LAVEAVLPLARHPLILARSIPITELLTRAEPALAESRARSVMTEARARAVANAHADRDAAAEQGEGHEKGTSSHRDSQPREGSRGGRRGGDGRLGRGLGRGLGGSILRDHTVDLSIGQTFVDAQP